ncbi:MAG: B12-binding domain-containing radical SAM protein [Deltaproteobacteria bacterium]|nr:B12-binding domain-containing radical SAM protein [Deltaproteobacteria bacterium]
MLKLLLVRPLLRLEKAGKDALPPPLGILSLAAYIRSKAPGLAETRIIDENIKAMNGNAWSSLLEDFRPDVVGISAMSLELGRVKFLVRLLKTWNAGLPIVLGGPLASSRTKDILGETGADAAVTGEGEKAFLELLEVLSNERLPVNAAIPGVVTVTDPPDKEPGVPELLQDLDELPFPAFDLVDLDPYWRNPRLTPVSKSRRYLPLFTSRGCPYRCSYCHNIFGKRFRAMSPDRVVEEIQYLHQRYGVDEFEIFDDIFNLDRDRVMSICSGIRKKGLKTRFSFPNGLRGDKLDREIITELSSVGTYHIAFAIETATPRLQKMINKNIDLDRIRMNISTAHKLGIFTWGFFMLGFPTETRREVLDTIRFARSLDLHGAFFFMVIPFEGTRLFEESMVKAGQPEHNYNYFYAERSASEKISAHELERLQTMAYMSFYLKPQRLLRLALDFPGKKTELAADAAKLFYYSGIERYFTNPLRKFFSA